VGYDRTTPALGYFLGARLWDEETVRELPMLRAEDRVTLEGRETPPAHGREGTEMRFVQPLRDRTGEVIAHLTVTNDSPMLRTLHTRADQLFTTITTGALILFAALLMLLSRSIAGHFSKSSTPCARAIAHRSQAWRNSARSLGSWRD
jgi:hypothetical protein